MAVTGEYLRVFPDLRTQVRSFVNKVREFKFRSSQAGEEGLPKQFAGFDSKTTDQVNSAKAMFEELNEVLAGKRPNRRFIIQ